MKAILLALLLSSLRLATAAGVTKEVVLGKKIDAEEEASRRTKIRDLRGDIGMTNTQPRELKRDLRAPKKRGAPRPRHYGYSDDGYSDDGYSDDQSYSDDDYSYSDDQYYGKGKGGPKGSKSPKGKGKGKGGGHYPDYPSDDEVYHNGNCQLVTFNETFAMPGPSLFLAPDTTVDDPGSPDLPGTVFIFEVTSILELDGTTPIEGTTVSGSCTRTTIGTDGGGTCDLIFIDDEGYTINVNGFLQGPLGSQLAITGGTGGMVGVIGEMDFFPVYETDSPGDLFLDAVRYEVIADLGIIVCET